MDGSANKIRIEKHAYNSNYCRPDWRGKCLENQKICLKNNGTICDALTTCFNVERIVAELNLVLPNEMVVSSTVVGR